MASESKVSWNGDVGSIRFVEDESALYRRSSLAGTDTSFGDGSSDDSEGFDTDLEDDMNLRSKLRILSTEDLYLKACDDLGVVPCSPFSRQLGSDDIYIDHYSIGPQGAVAIARAMVKDTVTSVLSLHDNGIEDSGGVAIASVLQENCYITGLDISLNFLAQESAKTFTAVLSNNKDLIDLNLGMNKFNDEDGVSFSKAIKENSSLKSLNLTRNGIGERGGAAIGEAIGENTTLVYLDLSVNCIRKDGAISIFAGLECNTTLRVVDLCDNGFGDLGAAAFKNAFMKNTTVREIDVSANQITCDGAVEIAKMLEVNKSIQVLRVGRNPIQSRGATFILDAIIANKESGVEELYMDGVAVSSQFEESLLELLQDRPYVYVEVGNIIQGKEHRRRSGEKKDLLARLLDYIELRGMRVVDLFRQMDRDSKLSLTKDELVQGLRRARIPMSRYQINNLFELLDTNKDGRVSYSEFARIRQTATYHRFSKQRRNSQWNH